MILSQVGPKASFAMAGTSKAQASKLRQRSRAAFSPPDEKKFIEASFTRLMKARTESSVSLSAAMAEEERDEQQKRQLD